MDIENIKTRLMQEYGYPAKGADLIVQQLTQLDHRLRDPFTRWWETGAEPAIEVEGYTLERLIIEQGMNPVASFLTLDWLLRDPGKAKASLRKGHDQVS